MVSLVNRFNDSLRNCSSADPTVFLDVRDAFVGLEDEHRKVRLDLQSDINFLSNLMDALGSEGINVKRAISIAEILFFAMYSRVPATAGFVIHWLSKMQSTSFLFACRDSEQSASSEAAKLRSLLELITLEMIETARNVSLTTETLDSDFFLSSPSKSIEIHDLIIEMSSNKGLCATICMSWGMFLHQLLLKVSEGEPHDPAYSPFIDHVFAGDAMEPHRYLIELAVGSHLLGDLDNLLETLPSANDEFYYSVLLNFFLDTQRYLQQTESTSIILARLIKSRSLANAAWQSPSTKQILDGVRQQFPHESRPFLRLTRALAHSGTRTIAYLEKVPTYTQAMPIGFKDFKTVSDEPGSKTLIELTQPLDLYSSNDLHGGVTVSTGSRGLLLKVPRSNSIVLWQHQYSALHYLARILQSSILALTAALHSDIIGDIIGLFSTLLVSSDDVDDFLQDIADEVGLPLPGMVFEIYEQIIQAHGSSRLLIECAHYFKALFRVDPEMAWAYVGQLSLFQPLDRVIERIVSTESDSEAYSLLISVCQLLSGAVSGLVSGALQSDARLQRTKSQFLLEALQSMGNFYQIYLHWPATDISNRYLLGAELNELFKKLIHLNSAAHFADATRTRHVRDVIGSATDKMTSSLIDCDSSSTTQLANLEKAIELCLSNGDEMEGVSRRFATAVFVFYGSVLSQRGKMTRSLPLRRLIFDRLRDFVQIMERNSSYRLIINRLLLDLFESEGPPLPSVLAHFASEKDTLKAVLFRCLREGSKIADETYYTLWQLLRHLMQPDQEGIALYLLSQEQDDTTSGLLHCIVKAITELDGDHWSPQELSHILDVLSAAQNWSALVFESLRSEAAFWTKLRRLFVLCNKQVVTQSDEVLVVYDSYRLVCAGLMARIFAANLSCMSPAERDNAQADTIALLDQVNAECLMINHYRASLHGNLSRNVSQKYPGFKLDALLRKQAHHIRYGDSFFFDTDLAQQMITANSFLRELRTANCNLSLVDAQARRIRGHHVLISSACLPTISDSKIWDLLMSIVIRVSGLQEDNTIPVSSDIVRERASTMTFVINALLLSATKLGRDQECLDLLEILAEKLLDHADISEPQSLTITRAMLQSVCQLVEFLTHITIPQGGQLSLQRTLATIFNVAICRFGADQVAHLQSTQDEATVQDLFILVVLGTSIATLLRKWELSTAPFAADMIQSPLVHNLIELFTALDGSLSNALVRHCASGALHMLITILDITNSASQLMHSGAIRMLVESRLCLALQRNPLLPHNDSDAHSLWLHGILPLVLGLISRLRVRMKDDTATFLTTYSKQIEANFASWSLPVVITRAQTEEFLLLFMLTEDYNSALGGNDNSFGETKKYLHERIDYLLSHPRTTAALVQPPEDQECVTENLKEALARLAKEET